VSRLGAMIQLQVKARRVVEHDAGELGLARGFVSRETVE
jgi:hypothetical protein